MTLPDEPRTLPKRTATKRVPPGFCACNAWRKISAIRLLAPITLVGLIALSVEISSELAGAELLRQLGDEPRAERVVFHRLRRLVLHHWHVLVRGGVEDGVWPEPGETARIRAASRMSATTGTMMPACPATESSCSI